MSQQRACIFLYDPTRTQVIQRALVELPDGGAVRTLDIVGKNLKLWFWIRLGVGRQQEIVIGLIGINKLRVLVHNNFTVEYAARPAVQHALVQLATDRPRLDVLDTRVIVHMLSASKYVKAVKVAVRVLTVQLSVDVVSHQPPAY